MKRFTVSALLALPSLALAQVPPAATKVEVRTDRREIRTDKRELARDRRQIADDKRDTRRFSVLIAALDQARAANQPQALAEIDGRVDKAIAAELAESGREQQQKVAEAARSGAEAARAGAETRRDVATGRPVAAADDRRDARDDRRDARDDRRDAAAEAAAAARLPGIQAEYRSLFGRFDPPSLDRKRVLLVELRGMSRAEVQGDKRELKEDRRELKEDRRELREDRRQRGR